MVSFWSRITPWALNAGFGLAALSGCGPSPATASGAKPDRALELAPPPPPTRSGRIDFPLDPEPNDILAHDPCSVRQAPDIFIWETEPQRMNKAETAYRLYSDLARLRRINPLFPCGLEKIQIVGQRNITVRAENDNVFGYYEPDERSISIATSKNANGVTIYGQMDLTVYHETGHHVHNLGIVSGIIKEALQHTWTIDTDIRSADKSCDALNCFVSLYAMTDALEDWADTFALVIWNPLGTAAALTFDIHEPNRFKLAQKVYTAFDIFPKQVRRYLSMRFGTAKPLPHSDLLIDTDTTVYLMSADNHSLSLHDAASGSEARHVVHQSKKVLKHYSSHANQNAAYGARVGDLLALYGRRHYFTASNDYRSTGIQFLPLHGGPMATPNPIHPEGIFGSIQRLDDRTLGYFTRERAQINYWSYHIKDGHTQKVTDWPVSEAFTPTHVMPLNNGRGDFLVVGYQRDLVPSLGTQIKAYRLSRAMRGANHGVAEAGDAYSLSTSDAEHLLTPVRVDNLILFPIFHEKSLGVPKLTFHSYGFQSHGLPAASFGFFGYDLSSDRWISLITTEISYLPAIMQDPANDIQDFHFWRDSNGQLHVLVSLQDGPSYDIPLDLSIREADSFGAATEG